MNSLSLFFSGVAMCGSWIAGVYFFRFWKKTSDRLFLMFGIAFWLMTLERLLLAFTSAPDQEEHYYFYIIRLVAFIIIMGAIIDKNRAGSRVD